MSNDFKYKEYEFISDIGMMTPDQYIRMIHILEEYRPKRIIELGSGQSTRIFKTYAAMANAKVYSIEHDPYWNKYDSILMPLNIKTQLTVCGYTFDDCQTYDGLEGWLEGQEKFDFVFIDGPNDAVPTNYLNLNYSRSQIFDFPIMDKLTHDAVIMYHDSESQVAQDTLQEFERILTEKEYTFKKEVTVERDKEIIEYNKHYLNTCPELTTYSITTP